MPPSSGPTNERLQCSDSVAVGERRRGGEGVSQDSLAEEMKGVYCIKVFEGDNKTLGRQEKKDVELYVKLNEVSRQKQINCTQDNSFYQRKEKRAALGGI